MTGLSAYEEARLENIRRNEAFLRSLGLIDEYGKSTTSVGKDDEFSAASRPKNGVQRKRTKKSHANSLESHPRSLNDSHLNAPHIKQEAVGINQLVNREGDYDNTSHAHSISGGFTACEASSNVKAPRRSLRIKGEAVDIGSLVKQEDIDNRRRTGTRSIVMEPNGYISDNSEGSSGEEDGDEEFSSEHASQKRKRKVKSETSSERVLLTSAGLRQFIHKRSEEHSSMVSDQVSIYELLLLFVPVLVVAVLLRCIL